MGKHYYRLFINENDKKALKRVPVNKGTIESIFTAYRNFPHPEVAMSFGCSEAGIYDFSEAVKVSFEKGKYNSLKMILNEENLGIINSQKHKKKLFNKCAEIWKLPLPFPKEN